MTRQNLDNPDFQEDDNTLERAADPVPAPQVDNRQTTQDLTGQTVQNFSEIEGESFGATPDLTGRGTPPGLIAPEMPGPRAAEQSVNNPRQKAADTGSHLGKTHGRTPAGGDMPGGGAAEIRE